MKTHIVPDSENIPATREASATAGTQKPVRHPKATGGLMGLVPPPKRKVQKKTAVKKEGEPNPDGLSDEEVREAEDRYYEGLQKVIDVIAPSAMEVGVKKITLGDGMLCRSFFIFNWPAQIQLNWMSPLVNMDARMEIAQFIYPAASNVVMRMLSRKVASLRATMNIRREKGFSRDPQMEAALNDAEGLRDLLAQGQEKLFQFGLYITIYADTDEKLKKIQTDVESNLGGKLILSRSGDFQMEHAWVSTLPFCLDEIEINRNMNTSPLSTSFPFSSSDLTSDSGILYGINRHNESLVIFDRFKLPNANSLVFATSGAGKSYTVKLEVIRYLMMNTTVYIIDPENEYTELADVVGGTVIPLSIQSSHRINPFDLPKATKHDDEESAPGELLRSAIINLHGLFKLMLREIASDEESILDKAILDTYALKGIHLHTENPGLIEAPTLDNLVDVLMTTDGGERMALVLRKYTEGSFAGLFNQPTNVKMNSELAVFQTRDLEDAIRPMAIYVTLNYLWNEVRSSLKRRLIIVDEAWNVMQHEDSARFLFGLFKRARKYYLGLTTITQDVEDFMKSPYGRPIVTNAAMQLLLKQAPAAIKSLSEAFDLTEGEKYLLMNAGVGQGVFFAGMKHVAIQIVASPKENEIVTTNPEDLARRKVERDAKRLQDQVNKAADLAAAEEKAAAAAPSPPADAGAAAPEAPQPQNGTEISGSVPTEPVPAAGDSAGTPTSTTTVSDDQFPLPPAEETEKK